MYQFIRDLMLRKSRVTYVLVYTTFPLASRYVVGCTEYAKLAPLPNPPNCEIGFLKVRTHSFFKTSSLLASPKQEKQSVHVEFIHLTSMKFHVYVKFIQKLRQSLLNGL